MRLINDEEFWSKVKSTSNVVVAINEYNYLIQTFEEQYPKLEEVGQIRLEDTSGWFKMDSSEPVLDFLLWVSNSEIKEESLFFDISPLVQIYFPLTDQSIINNFPNHLGEVCCKQSSFDEKALLEAWNLVQKCSIDWMILDTTDPNNNDNYILIEKEENFFIDDDLRDRLNIFRTHWD